MRLLKLGYFVLGLGCSAQAQSKRFLIEETVAKSGMSERFELAQKDYCAAVIRGGAPSCTILSPTTFSPPDLYLTLLAFGSFRHYDEGTYTSKGLTPDQAHDLSARRIPTISANQESAIELQEGLSFGDPQNNSLAEITEVQVRPGSAPAFLKLLKDLALPAARKANFASFEVYRTVVGGSPERFFIIRRLRNFAELDATDPLRTAMSGSQQAQFDTALSTSTVSVNVRVMRFRPDLSARP